MDKLSETIEQRKTRLTAYAVAERATVRAGAKLDVDTQMLIRRAVDLAIQTPALRIEWVQRASLTGDRLAASGTAIAFTTQRIVAVPPIVDASSGAVVLHEIGHCRRHTRGELASEVAAWRFALENALVWDANAHNRMREALRSYVHGSKGANELLQIAEIERICSERTLTAYERSISVADIAAFRVSEFRDTHGHRLCAVRCCLGNPPAAAVAMFGERPVCDHCRTELEIKATRRRITVRQIDARINDGSTFQRRADDAAIAAYKRRRRPQGYR